MSALVTGGAGFIGSHVAEELARSGEHVVVLDDLSGGSVANLPRNITFVPGSINDVDLVNRLFGKYQFDCIFHLAAYAAEGLSHFIKTFNYTNNLLGSVNLINAAVNHEVSVFVFASSIAVYGRNQVPMTEELTPRPTDPYGIAKYAVELDLAQSRQMFGLDYIVFRLHNVYGERQNIGDGHRNVIGIFMNQAMQGLPMTIFGDGLQTRAFSYISDVAPVIAQSIKRKECLNTVFNVGADQAYTVLELARIVSAAMGVKSNVTHVRARDEVVHAFSSHDRVKAVFGDLVRNVSLEEGVSRMAEWVRRVGPRASTFFGRVEVAKNLPESWRRMLRPTRG